MHRTCMYPPTHMTHACILLLIWERGSLEILSTAAEVSVGVVSEGGKSKAGEGCKVCSENVDAERGGGMVGRE